MRILHVCRGMEVQSGVTHIICSLSEEQAKLGHDVELYYIDHPGSHVLPEMGLVYSQRYPVTGGPLRFGFSTTFYTELLARKNEFDVVHIHGVWNFASYAAMRCSHKSHTPYVVSPQGSFEPWAMKHHWMRKAIYMYGVELPLIRRASAIQALTIKEGAQCRALGCKNRIAIIPNGVRGSVRGSEPIRKSGYLVKTKDCAKGGPETRLVCLFLGRIHPKKGLLTLLEAWSIVSKKSVAAELWIAGDDAGSGYLREVVAKADQLVLRESVRFLGKVAGEEKSIIFQSADIFVLATESEGLPMAVLEAMSFGLPVVTTESANIPEIAEARAGILCDKSAKSVANGILRLFADSELRTSFGQSARTLAENRFCWSRIARKTIRLYKRLVGEG